jgi:hypothetical protein
MAGSRRRFAVPNAPTTRTGLTRRQALGLKAVSGLPAGHGERPRTKPTAFELLGGHGEPTHVHDGWACGGASTYQ